MRKITMEENRQFQIDVLGTIDRYCKENGIKYFLIAGTLLGAVRHHGYIPWDDDIDIIMLRDDYEKFVKEFNVDGYYVVAPELNTKGYYLPFAKVCMENTFVEEKSKIMTAKLGINVDLFPIDTVPEDNKARKKQLAHIKMNRNVLDIIDTSVSRQRSWYRNALLTILQFFLLPVSPQKVVSRIVSLSKMFDGKESSLCGEIAWGCGEREIVHTDVFKDIEQLEFEGKKYDCPKGWDEWLSKRYGDYMKLPPLEQQKTHHDCNAYLLNEE